MLGSLFLENAGEGRDLPTEYMTLGGHPRQTCQDYKTQEREPYPSLTALDDSLGVERAAIAPSHCSLPTDLIQRTVLSWLRWDITSLKVLAPRFGAKCKDDRI